MVDLLRIYGPALLGLVVTIVLLWVILIVSLKNTPPDVLSDAAKKGIKKVAVIVISLGALAYVLFLVMSLSVNVTPRGVIDRSTTLDQQKSFEQRHMNGEAK